MLLRLENKRKHGIWKFTRITERLKNLRWKISESGCPRKLKKFACLPPTLLYQLWRLYQESRAQSSMRSWYLNPATTKQMRTDIALGSDTGRNYRHSKIQTIIAMVIAVQKQPGKLANNSRKKKIVLWWLGGGYLSSCGWPALKLGATDWCPLPLEKFSCWDCQGLECPQRLCLDWYGNVQIDEWVMMLSFSQMKLVVDAMIIKKRPRCAWV